MKNDWNEPELSRHLGPVQAPEELWDRVHGADSSQRGFVLRPRRQVSSAWQWAAAALATVAIVAGITVWQNRDISGEERAVRALSRTPEQLEFRSENQTEVRTWVKSGTGMDVPMPGRTSPAVRMIGARVDRAGVPTAEIAYRVGDADVSLVVSRIPQEGDGRHQFVKSGSYHGSSFQSWTMRGQMYTIASVDARAGCLLCHSTGAPRTSVN
jgi:anti-sigma factor RsiW